MTNLQMGCDPQVREFFDAHRSPFGCNNILPDHLPSTERVQQVVANAMTVDIAVSRAYGLETYASFVRNFARHWAQEGHDGQTHDADQGWFSGDPRAYIAHFEAVTSLPPEAFLRATEAALGNCIESIHLFCPKQCNMACRGCYAGAVPIDRFPYQDSHVHAYVEGVQSLLQEAQRYGVRVVQTSGDGELTAFPRFFDLLTWVAEQGLQWLFFTAGAIFGSEPAARAHWADAERSLSAPTRDRIRRNIQRFEGKVARPTAEAFLQEIERVKDHVQIYHSVWSTSRQHNDEWRNPRFSSYDYESVTLKGRTFELPASLLGLMEVFKGPHRGRLGIESPVGPASQKTVNDLATWVVAHGLRSYFEPVLTTGRARNGMFHLQRPDADAWLDEARPFLVRSLCSFRFIHQAVVKVRAAQPEDEAMEFFVMPGTAIDIGDLERLGVLDSLQFERGGFFGAHRSGVVVRSNYLFTTGCKCNDFSRRLQKDCHGLATELRAATAAGCPPSANPEELLRCLAV